MGKKVLKLAFKDSGINNNLNHFKLKLLNDVRNIIKHGLNWALLIKCPINQFAKA